VSRVGSSAQTKAMKKVAGKLKLSLAQFREMEAFAQFGSDLDAETQRQLDLGRRMTEVLKQPQYSPISLEREVVILYAVNNGHFNEIPVDKMQETESKFYNFMDTNAKDVMTGIKEKKELTEELENRLKESIKQFVESVK